MPVNEVTLDTITITDLATIANAGSHSFGLAMQNQVSHQQAMNQVGLAGSGSITKRLVEIDVAEAAALTPLVAEVAKIAQSTPSK